MPAPWEMDWSAATPAPAQEAATAGKPWEKDWSAAALSPDQQHETGLAAVAKRIATWPGRIANTVKDIAVSGATLPRDVLEGKVDLSTEEGLREGAKRGMDTVSLVNPASVARSTTGQIARRAFLPGEANPAFKAVTPNIQAANTAADLGAPLPAGLVSENKGIQAVTQAARSLPMVGAEIDKRVAGTIDAAGNKVKDIAGNLSGGVPDRAQAGANLRPSLQGVITDNNDRIDSAFAALRHVVDTDKVAPLPRTRATLGAIVADRTAAGHKNPFAGLEDIANLSRDGASFNGLQRARSDIGNSLNFGAANPGFNKGDLKRVYGAMSGDMENVVRANAQPGIHPDQAAMVLKAANAGSSKLIESNKTVQKLLNIKSDEGLVGNVINAAQDKTGNAKLLMQLRSQMPRDDFEQIVGVGLSELGHNPATGEFSLAKFGTGYRKLGDTAKSVLFPDPAHRKALESIANLDAILKDSDKYINKSGTGRVNALTAGLGAIGGAAASGNIPAVLGALGAGAGGFGLAKYLGRPATASALAKWIKVAQNAPRVPGPTGQAMLGMASRNLLSNLSDASGLVGVKRLAAPATDRPEDKRPNNSAIGNPERRKVSDRHPQ